MSRDMCVYGIGCFRDEYVNAGFVYDRWLTGNPAPIIWAKSILMFDKDYQVFPFVVSQRYAVDAELIALALDKLKHEGVLVVDNQDRLLSGYSDDVAEMCALADMKCRNQIVTAKHDSSGKSSPSEFEFGFSSICGMGLLAGYQNLFASSYIGRTCLVDSNFATHLDCQSEIDSVNAAIAAFGQLYEVAVPVVKPSEYKLFCRKPSFDECIHAETCWAEQAINLDRYIDRILGVRDLRELQQLAKLVDSASVEIGADEARLISAVNKEIRDDARRIQFALPEISKWSNIACASLAIGTGIAAYFSNGADLMPAMSIASGASGLAAHAIDSYIKDNQWKVSYVKSTLGMEGPGQRCR